MSFVSILENDWIHRISAAIGVFFRDLTLSKTYSLHFAGANLIIRAPGQMTGLRTSQTYKVGPVDPKPDLWRNFSANQLSGIGRRGRFP